MNVNLVPIPEGGRGPKKGLDFNDFKIICNAIYIGAHRVKYIKDLIIKLSCAPPYE